MPHLGMELDGLIPFTKADLGFCPGFATYQLCDLGDDTVYLNLSFVPCEIGDHS